ncbi:MAG TPA: rhodanese-like domain-containing protein [Gaiellaceae bacterium]|nr:rhodanese-like domain-containing protein [Gaiellaceae bacterium]
MLFRQFVDDDLGCASYLVGDEEAGEALVVDPAYAIEPYLAAAAAAGVRIVRVLETHTHADHVSGHGRLALEHGIPVAIHPLAEPEFPFEPLADGQELRVGSLVVRVLHTPGHRPEHCSFLVPGRLVLTGDSLFVGDAARPDLAVEAREGAEGLFRSLRRLAALGDGVAVYPGHVAGSLCGGSMSSEPRSTIGAERGANPMLAIGELQRFVAVSAAISAPRPPTVERCVALNRGPFLGAPPALARLDAPGEATLLDVRPLDAFFAGHLPGAISVPVAGSSFATKAAFVLDPDERVVLHASSDDEAELAARRLRAAGLVDDLAGYLVEPAGATERLEPVPVAELERLVAADAVTVLDVREPDEFAAGHVPGAVNLPYRLARGGAPLDGKPVVTICESGPRATVAASVLARAGADARPVAAGGMNAWRGSVER